MAHRESEALDALSLPAPLRDPIGMLRRRWPWMGITFLASAVIGVAAIWWGVPRAYVASSTVLVASQPLAEGLVPQTVREGAFSKVNAILGEALSVEHLATVIEAHDLYPEARAELPMSEVVDIMRRNVRFAPQETIAPYPHVETSRLFTISFREGSPERAAAVANDLAERFVAAGTSVRSRQGAVATELLENRLTLAEQELLEHDQRISAFKAEHRRELGEASTAAAEVAQLRSTLSQALAHSTEAHPNIQTLRRQIASAARRAEQGQVHLEQLVQLEQARETARETFLDLQRRVQDAQLSQGLEASRRDDMITVLDRATPPTRPERSRVKFGLAALLASLGLAVGVGFALELRDPVVLADHDFESLYGLPVLGSAPRMR